MDIGTVLKLLTIFLLMMKVYSLQKLMHSSQYSYRISCDKVLSLKHYNFYFIYCYIVVLDIPCDSEI